MKKPPTSLLIGYLLFGGFMVLESGLRQGRRPAPPVAGAMTRGPVDSLALLMARAS
jgi:hypothetical protein